MGEAARDLGLPVEEVVADVLVRLAGRGALAALSDAVPAAVLPLQESQAPAAPRTGTAPLWATANMNITAVSTGAQGTPVASRATRGRR